jgi:hypothetical protein
MDGDFRRIHLGEGFKRTHIPTLGTIVQCACGAAYKRTETKFLVPRTGHASCKVCGAALESWFTLPHSNWSTVQTDGITNRWRTFYGSNAVLKSPRDCTTLGIVDETRRTH